MSLVENSVEVAKEWASFIFKCATNQRMQNLSPWENLMKLRSVLDYGKAEIDEKHHILPVQT